MINKAVNNTEKNIRMQVGGVTTLGIDTDADNFNFNKVRHLTEVDIKKIGKTSTVKEYDYGSTFTLDGYNIFNSQGNNFLKIEHFLFQGVSNPKILDFQTEKARLIKGKTFNQADLDGKIYKTIISSGLAKANHLNIGSKLKINYPIPGTQAVLHYKFTIIGIYDLQKTQEITQKNLKQDLINTLYIPEPTFSTIHKAADKEILKVDPDSKMVSKDPVIGMPIFVLNDLLTLEKFKKEAKPFLPKYYIVSDSSNAFDTIAAPMKNMWWIASIALYVGIITTLIILSLLITLFLRDRKHEIGIYLSLGEKKKKVVTQILLEVLMISVIGVGASLVTGNLIAKNISEKMVANQVNVTKTGNGPADIDVLGGMGYGNITKDELIKSYHIRIDSQTVAIFCIAELGSILISTAIPVTYVIRLKPKKILM